MATSPRIADCPQSVRRAPAAPATCVEEALARQARCRQRYRAVIGTSYAPDAYTNLLEATRAVLRAARE